MKKLTGNEALKMIGASKQIYHSAISSNYDIIGMYRTPAGNIAEHSVQFGIMHVLRIYDADEIKKAQNTQLHKFIQ